MNFTDQFLHATIFARSLDVVAMNTVGTLIIIGRSEDGILPTEIARKLKVSPAVITGAVRMLTQLGLVEQLMETLDRRKRPVVITEKGLDAIAMMLPTEDIQ